MLYNEEEIDLVKNAMEPGIRNPNRPTRGPKEILRDFFKGVDFNGSRVLELGPGHYEFCEVIRENNGTVDSIELDPVVVKLGESRGFKVLQGDLRSLPEFQFDRKYDGLFSKGSTNPFWFYDDRESLLLYTKTLLSLIKEDGWIWIVSCPFTQESLTDSQFKQWLDVEESVYSELGFTRWTIPNKFISAYYAISQPCPILSVYSINLPQPTIGLASRLNFTRFIIKQSVSKLLRTFKTW